VQKPGVNTEKEGGPGVCVREQAVGCPGVGPLHVVGVHADLAAQGGPPHAKRVGSDRPQGVRGGVPAPGVGVPGGRAGGAAHGEEVQVVQIEGKGVQVKPTERVCEAVIMALASFLERSLMVVGKLAPWKIASQKIPVGLWAGSHGAA